MFEYLEGTLQSITSDATILDVGGIGYRIHTPKTCASRCLPQNQRLKLYVDLVIREDAHTLYGFSSPQDRDFFQLLQQVNGIGPKVALNILSHAPVSEIASTIFQKDAKTLSSIPGIGKKLAERLIVELHERIDSLVASGTCSSSPTIHEAIRALQTLGFSASEARNAISTAKNHFPQTTSIEQLIQHALSTRS